MGDVPTLSLCMIVKNEAAHLQRCLEATRPLVDEIVIADTGSTDDTRQIAALYADRLLTFPWCDDFAAARNFVLEHASSDWVLSLDADETIARRDHHRIRTALRQTPVDAVESYQRHYLVDGLVVGWKPGPGGYDEGFAYPGYFDVSCRRLFRRASHLRWRNPVHEELCSLDPARALRAVADTWIIHHFGKTDPPERLAEKASLYLRLGLQKAAELPHDALAQYELGIQLQELQRWDEALAAFQRTAVLERGFRQSDLYIAICLARLGQHDNALESLARAHRSTPASLGEISLEEGNVYLAKEEYTKAAEAYERALHHTPALAPAAFNLALIALRTPDRDTAKRWLDRALEYAPFNRDARILRATMRHEEREPLRALDDLNAVYNDPRAARLRARIHLEAGDAAAAAAALAVAPQEDTPAHLAMVGAVALARGQAAEARRALEKAWLDGETVETALNLASARLATGDADGALVAVGEALHLDPEHETARERHRALSPANRPAAAPPHGCPLKIFFWHPRGLGYDGRTPRTKGLGGTESAVVYLAEALAERGHTVGVFNTCDEPLSVNKVEYAAWQTLPRRAAADHPDVVVAVRDWKPISRNRFAPLQLFWTGDAYDQPYLEGIAADPFNSALDLVVLQSRWQIDTIQRAHGISPWRIATTRLGYGPRSDEEQPPGASRPRRLAYTSTPFRGLDVLLELFPAIRERCPDAELKVFSSMRVYGVGDAEDRATFEDIYRRAEQPGVTLVGTVPQPALARELESCRILAYPNHWPETFCIAAIEAQAAGCPVLTSAVGALPETVGDGGLCLDGDPRSPAYQQAFVNAAVELLNNDDRWNAFSLRARSRAVPFFSWAAIAAEWEQLVLGAIANESSAAERLVQHLGAGRMVLAANMIEKTSCPAGTDDAAWDDLSELAARLASGQPIPVTLASRVTMAFGAIRRAHTIEAAFEARRATPPTDVSPSVERDTVARIGHAG
jgi:glycosyltransferase involved in cell wall biosynthesis/Tfp pilus assembly protein PilF